MNKTVSFKVNLDDNLSNYLLRLYIKLNAHKLFNGNVILKQINHEKNKCNN